MSARDSATFIGVDGGGTRVRAVLAGADGAILARAEADGAVVSAAGASEAVAAIGAAVRALRSERGGAVAGDEPVTALWAGLAGAGREDARSVAEAALRASGLARSVRVGTDAEAAFEDAFGPGPGILLIAGTGSIAIGRAREGAPFRRVGGWGPGLGDEGSGHWMAMQALACVARAEDGRAARTALRAAVLEYLELEDPRALIGWLAGAPKGEVAGLAPAVFHAAASGDGVAASIVTDGAAALRDHVIALLDRLTAEGSEVAEARPRLALSGALIAPGGPLRRVLLELSAPLGLDVLDRAVDAAAGAARLARRMAS